MLRWANNMAARSGAARRRRSARIVDGDVDAGHREADVVEDLLLEFVSRMSASGALMALSTAPNGCCSYTCPPIA